MSAFASGKADVLVATTVIEVGIDVPNATVMVIENAERFGISQLHQLRGRVGRGEHRASCFLVGAPTSAGSAKLRAMVEHADGFRLAEIDLGLRKEGELVGTRQSGSHQFDVASLPEDAHLLERARAHAEAIVAADPELRAPEHALLGARARADVRRRGARADPGLAAVGSSRATPYGGGMRVIAGTSRRQAIEGAAGQGHEADLRPREGGAVRDARPTFRARACSTCSRAPARWASRRCRGAPPGRCSSSATQAR